MKKFVLFSSVFISFILSSCSNQEVISEDVVLENLKEEIKNRIIVNEAIDSLASFAYEGKAFLIDNTSDSILIIDNTINQVFLFDDDLNLINGYLKQGDGPGEHVGVKRFFFTSGFSYSTFDHSQQLFRIFDRNDSVLVFNKFDGDIWVDDMVQINDSIYLFPENFQDEYSFVVKNLINNEILFKYNVLDLLSGVVSDDALKQLPYDKNLIFEGYFSKGDGDEIVYTSNKTGLFFVFNSSGKFLYTKRTIDKLPLPKFGKKEIAPGYFLHEVVPDFRGNKSRAINENFVFILSNILLPSYYGRRPIDIYSVNSGEYLFSFFVPNLNDGQESVEIAVIGNLLYVLYENSTIVKYELKRNGFNDELI